MRGRLDPPGVLLEVTPFYVVLSAAVDYSALLLTVNEPSVANGGVFRYVASGGVFRSVTNDGTFHPVANCGAFRAVVNGE